MSVLDIQANFTAGATPYVDITGAAGTYLAPNSYDTSPLGTYLTEVSVNDTQVSNSVNTFRDLGSGERIFLVVDWIVAPTGGTSCDTQLITSASSALTSPTTMIDFTAIAIASLTKGTRQIMPLPRSASYLQYLGVQVVTVGTMTAGRFIAWLAKDIDAVVFGYASGFTLK